LTKFDRLNFREFERLTGHRRTMAGEAMRLFGRAVPEFYWHYFLSSMLNAWDPERFNPRTEAIRQRAGATNRFL